jgi:type I restriction enzyme S subunit
MDWVKVKLEKIAEEKRESYEPNSEESLNYIGLEHIEQQTLRLNGTGRSNETISSKKKFSSGDILFGSLRPYFRKVYKPNFNGVCSTDITVIRSKQNFSQEYLFYLVANQSFIDYATNYSNGTRMPRTNWKVISKSEWKVPKDKCDQQKIASILSAYDDLIENNTRRIKILEEMAQTIYKEWFVNFRFPGYEKVKFVESQLGNLSNGQTRIPNGWEVKKLNEIANIQMGQSPKSEYYNNEGDGLPFHQGVKDFSNRFPNHTIFCTYQGRIANKGDILLSVRAPVGRLNISPSKIVIGRGLSSIKHKKNYQSFLYYKLREIFREEDSMGSGAIFNAVTKSDLFNLEILLPNNSLDKKFNEKVEAIDKEIEIFTLKNQNLHKTRDLLLPKLISGEVEV